MAITILRPTLTDATGLFSATATKLTALIRARTMPRGVAGYVFDVVESYQVEMRSSITDKVFSGSELEKGKTKSGDSVDPEKQYTKPLLDILPETITVKGLVAEVSSTVPYFPEKLDPIVRAFEPVMAYVPNLAQNALKAYAEAERIARVTEKVINQYNSLYKLYDEKWGKNRKPKGAKPDAADVPQTKQREIFEFFRYLWASQQLVTVETAWGIYKQMAIESITATQDSGRYLSSFTMKFKQLVTVNTEDLNAMKKLAGVKKRINKEGTAGTRSVLFEHAFKDFYATEKTGTPARASS